MNLWKKIFDFSFLASNLSANSLGSARVDLEPMVNLSLVTVCKSILYLLNSYQIYISVELFFFRRVLWTKSKDIYWLVIFCFLFIICLSLGERTYVSLTGVILSQRNFCFYSICQDPNVGKSVLGSVPLCFFLCHLRWLTCNFYSVYPFSIKKKITLF